MAISSGGARGGPKEKTRYFCHSCGGVTVDLTPKDAAEDREHGHDLEVWPPKGEGRGNLTISPNAQDGADPLAERPGRNLGQSSTGREGGSR